MRERITPPAKAVLMIPMPKGPGGASLICTTAIFLISSAAANVVYGMQSGDLNPGRFLWTLLGLVGGGSAVYVFKCHTMLSGGDHGDQP